MKKNKILIIVLIAIIAIVFIIVGKIGKKEETDTNNIKQEEYTIENSDGTKINTSEALKKPREELGYSISNITLVRQDAQTVFKLQLANEGTTDKEGQLVDIVFIDKNGNEEARMALYIRKIEAGKSIETQATINNDFTNVYDFKLETRN